jgi:superfamily II DNA helicase RecQ
VPTVALAIDQYRAARELPLLSHLDARYFAADDPDFSAQQVADAVRAGSTRLLFTSPEACVSGRLRYVIDELASQGRLDHVVIDEAHMVGTWGIYFRVDLIGRAGRDLGVEKRREESLLRPESTSLFRNARCSTRSGFAPW